MKPVVACVAIVALVCILVAAQRLARFDPAYIYSNTDQGWDELGEALEELRVQPDVSDIDILLASLRNHHALYGESGITLDILLELSGYFRQFGTEITTVPEELVLLSVRALLKTSRYQKAGEAVLAAGTPPRLIVPPVVKLSNEAELALKAVLPPGIEIIRQSGDAGLFFYEKGVRNFVIIVPHRQFGNYYDLSVVIENGHQAGMRGLFELTDEGPVLVSYY